MKTLKLFILSAVFVTACSDEATKVSPAKTKAAFDNVNETLGADLAALQSSPGLSGMNSLASITSTNNPFAAGRISSFKRAEVRDYLKQSTLALRSIITNASSGNERVSGSEPFDYTAHKGTYTWNGEGWTKSESTIIKIIFPTVEGSSTNDGEFQLTAYEEVAIQSDFGIEYNPTVIHATLNVGGTKKAQIDLEAEYNATSGEPILIDLYLLFDPFSIELALNDKKETSTSFSFALSKSSSTLIGVGATVNYNSSDKSESNISKLSGYVQLLNVKFVINIDASNAGPNSDINDIIQITIKVNGDTAGKVVFDESTGEPLVKYTDGSTEPLSGLFASLEAELGGLGL